MLKFKKIEISSKEKTLVDISFEIRKSLALVGESGSGKSLTLKSIISMLPPNLKLEIDYELPFELIRGESVAFVPQNPFTALSPMTKISKQWFGSTEKAKELFKVMSLDWELFFRYPPKLSGGQLQRVIFAMALVNEPKLLLLDEPTTALDPNLRDGVAKTLLELQNRFGFVILFVTHDINLASKICDDILVIKDGRVVEIGESQVILKKPKDFYTKSLVEANFANREFRE